MRSLAVALLAVLVATTGIACGDKSDEAALQPATETEAPSDPTRVAAPELVGQTLDGKAIALGDFRGRPVL